LQDSVKVIHCNLCDKKFELEDNARDHVMVEHDMINAHIGFTIEFIEVEK